MARLPDWLAAEAVPPPTTALRGRGGVRFARKGLAAVFGAAVALLDPREGGLRRGWLCEIDARAKIVGLLGLLACALFSRSLAALVACLFWVLLVWALGGVGWQRLGAALLGVPLFAVALCTPAALNLVTPGRPVLVLCHLGAGSWGPWSWPETLALTDQGLLVAVRLLLRIAACASIGALMTASTRPGDLFRGLRGLGVPSGFVLVLDMTVRYLAVLLQSAEEIHLAKLSRSIAHVPTRRDRAWVAAGIGEVYRKSRKLAGEVGDAMVSRGFSGEVKSLSAGCWGWPETAFVCASAVGATSSLVLGWGG
jgi:energy-coupling factor transporter transmembrane protein EcfT